MATGLGVYHKTQNTEISAMQHTIMLNVPLSSEIHNNVS